MKSRILSDRPLGRSSWSVKRSQCLHLQDQVVQQDNNLPNSAISQIFVIDQTLKSEGAIMCYLVTANKHMSGSRDECPTWALELLLARNLKKAHRRTSSNVTSITTSLKMRMPEAAQRNGDI